MIINLLKRLIFGKPRVAPPRYEVYHNHTHKLWIAEFKDKIGNGIGIKGFGHTSADAVKDLFYQNIDLFE